MNHSVASASIFDNFDAIKYSNHWLHTRRRDTFCCEAISKMHKPFERIFTMVAHSPSTSYCKHLLLNVTAILWNDPQESSPALSLSLCPFFSLALPHSEPLNNIFKAAIACTCLIVRLQRPLHRIHGFPSRLKFPVPVRTQPTIIDKNGIGMWLNLFSSASGFNLFLFFFIVNTIQSPFWQTQSSIGILIDSNVLLITAKLITIYR